MVNVGFQTDESFTTMAHFNISKRGDVVFSPSRTLPSLLSLPHGEIFVNGGGDDKVTNNTELFLGSRQNRPPHYHLFLWRQKPMTEYDELIQQLKDKAVELDKSYHELLAYEKAYAYAMGYEDGIKQRRLQNTPTLCRPLP